MGWVQVNRGRARVYVNGCALQPLSICYIHGRNVGNNIHNIELHFLNDCGDIVGRTVTFAAVAPDVALKQTN